MTMTDKTEDDALLEDFFVAARAHPPQPSAELMARIAADAGQLAPKPSAVAPRRKAGGGWRLGALFGGWSAMGGLATAAVAGVWIGFAGAERFGSVAGGMFGMDQAESSVNLLPDGAGLALLTDN